MLKTVIRSYEALSKDELYALLNLRSEIFVVEQNCAYQDVDYQDQKALHVLGYVNNELVAYTRLFKAGDYFDKASIGRVLVKKNFRALNYGNLIMEVSMVTIETRFKEDTIKISAQRYLKNFYNRLGFVEDGEPYLEDGIPHIGMIKTY